MSSTVNPLSHSTILFWFVGMIAALDEAIGNITDALYEQGFMDNALIIFTTDVSFYFTL